MNESTLFPVAAALLAFWLVLCPAAMAATISFNPSSIVLFADGNDSVTVMIDELPEGLSGYIFTAEITNPEIAEISGVSFPEWTSLTSATTVPSSQVKIEVGDVENQVVAGATNVVLATINIRPKNAGSSALDLLDVRIENESGFSFEPSVNAASVTVPSSSGDGSSSGSWSAGGGSGGGSSGESTVAATGTSSFGNTSDGAEPSGTDAPTLRTGEVSGGSDPEGASPDGSEAEAASVAAPTEVPPPSGTFPIPSLWIAVIVIMVGSAAAVLYLAVTKRL